MYIPRLQGTFFFTQTATLWSLPRDTGSEARWWHGAQTHSLNIFSLSFSLSLLYIVYYMISPPLRANRTV